MKKYDVMGWEMAKMEDVKWAIRETRKDIELLHKNNSDEAKSLALEVLNEVVRLMYIDEIKAAKSEEDVNDIIEMTGDFVVAKHEDGKTTYFKEWDCKNAVVSIRPFMAMSFAYESMAKHVAEELEDIDGGKWIVIDRCGAATENTQRLFDAIFNHDDEDENE